MPTDLLVLLNLRAGTAGHGRAGLAGAVRAEFARHGRPAEVQAVHPERLAATLRVAAARRPTAVIVGGGDGTLSTAARALAGTGVALGILPLGTLNHFALDAGVPADWRDAVALAATGPARAVDLAEVNGRLFLNTCSLGGYVTALRRREVLRRRASHGKARAMFWGTLAALRRVPRLHVELRSAERHVSLRASFVLIANNRYQDDVIVSGRRARLDSGRLCIYASHVHRYRDLLRTLLETWRRGIYGATELVSWETADLEIRCREHPLHGAIDGEVELLEPPLSLRSRPQALRLIAPPAAA